MPLLRLLRAPTLTIRPITTIRPLSTTPPKHLKEGADRSPSELNNLKDSQVDKQKQGQGHWHEELASAGESAIAADKGGEKVEDHGEHMEDLQKETAGKAEAEHPDGKKD